MNEDGTIEWFAPADTDFWGSADEECEEEVEEIIE